MKFLFFLIILFPFFTLSQQNDAEYPKVKDKIEASLKDKNYKKSLKLTEKHLSKWPKDPFLNYAAAVSLFNSFSDKKIQKKFPDELTLWQKVIEFLTIGKAFEDKSNEKFQLKVQKKLIQLADKKYKADYNSAKAFYALFFNFFNLNEETVNQSAALVQLNYFEIGERKYFDGDTKQAFEIFDWLYLTFFNKEYSYVLDIISLIGDRDSEYDEWRHPKYYLSHTARKIESLSEHEQLVVAVHNLVRMNSQLFEKTFLNTFIKTHSGFSNENSYVKSLREDLKKSAVRKLMLPHELLIKAAKYHASDTKNPDKGHFSSDGRSFGERIREFGVKGKVGESISFSYTEADEIVINLLIDKGVESLGHRKSILERGFVTIGTSIHTHLKYEWICVINYSDQ